MFWCDVHKDYYNDGKIVMKKNDFSMKLSCGRVFVNEMHPRLIQGPSWAPRK